MSPYTLKNDKEQPYLGKKMVHVKFMYESQVIHYRNSDDNEFETADFLKSSFELKGEPSPKNVGYNCNFLGSKVSRRTNRNDVTTCALCISF
ncbi:hypothetical protein PoB_000484500 [Plakobranchus ocellatus]|uniref:Uncharacterized protein n=1 Tax=Plakobranchus ocellatus TaxID=259542 RepID=A0AAV3Y784_9GAST|nr:hypothetical protein PoB_000484500 [Plakobranchus ocellatus]